MPVFSGTRIERRYGMSQIVTYLRGKTLLITGATGFLAKAVVEKILRCAPEVGRIYLVVRSRRKKDGTTLSAAERVEEEILRSAAFARLRGMHGGRFAEVMAEKVHAVEGDLTLDHIGLEPDLYQRLAEEVDVVLTCAASVTFDEEIDAALQLNTLGARRMMEFARTCNDALLVHVSTAYVNGQLKGRIPEVPPRPDWSMAQEMGIGDAPFDLERETRDILAKAEEIHDASRSAVQQKRFRKTALQQNARPTQRWLDAQVETFRKRWLKEQLIAEGMRRGQRWGWHDSYTLTKAMGEQLIVKHRGDLPTVIIRPSIVESSLVEPEPGWIEGLKVADPLIDAVSKGRLPDFPGDRDMIVDIIPVDIVANSMLAAMERTAREGGISVYHVSTGDRNPIRFQEAFELSYEYFQQHPRLNRNNEPIPIRRWTYPTLARFRRRYNLRYVYPLNAALWVFNRFSRISSLNNLKRRITVLKSAISRMLYYASIYSPYTSLECTFETGRTVDLHERLDPEDRRLFNGDVSGIHWKTYFQDIHIPGLKRHVLKTDEPRPSVTEEEEVAERSGFAQAEADPLPHLDTLTDILAKSADMYGDKTAMQMARDGEWVRYSFKDVHDLAGHMGWRWRSGGLHPGDRVLLFSENKPEWCIACFAGLVAGAVLVPVDRRSSAQEVWRIARFTGSRAILSSESGFELLKGSEPPGHEVMFWNIDNYGLPFDVPRRSAPPVVPNEEPPAWAPVQPDAPAAIMFTRGMAAESHGVVLSHRNFVANLLSLAEILRAYRTDHFLSLLPMSQALEFTGGFLMPFYAGATITFTPSVRPRSLVALMAETGINCLIAAPRIFGLLLRPLQRLAGVDGERDGGVLSRMRLLVSGGGTLEPDLYHAYREIGLTIHEGYGLTEAAPVVTVNPMDRSKPSSVGVALPGVDVRIDEPDGEGKGEIVVRGSNVMRGYFENPAATEHRIRDGWLHTGDLGYIDRDGYLYIADRMERGGGTDDGPGGRQGNGKPRSATAFFDVDGTIVDATIVHYYAFYRTWGYSDLRRLLWTLGFLPRIVYYMVLDKISRSRFNRVFYRQYRGFERGECVSRSERLFDEVMRPRMFAGAVERIRAHQQRGERVVLVTGSLDFIMEPLAEYTKADDLIALSMKESGGRLTGETDGPPIGDEAKARIVREYAERRGIDLSRSYAYADSSSDQPMLSVVGRAVAVNPGGKLKKAAESGGWEVVHWTRA